MNIIIGLLIYIIIGCIVTKVSRLTIFADDIGECDEDSSIILGSAWPILLPILPIMIIWMVARLIFFVIDAVIDVLYYNIFKTW